MRGRPRARNIYCSRVCSRERGLCSDVSVARFLYLVLLRAQERGEPLLGGAGEMGSSGELGQQLLCSRHRPSFIGAVASLPPSAPASSLHQILSHMASASGSSVSWGSRSSCF